jgi:hypothetical protein
LNSKTIVHAGTHPILFKQRENEHENLLQIHFYPDFAGINHGPGSAGPRRLDHYRQFVG